MIQLKVKDYCHSCSDFKPDTVTIGISHGFSDKLIYETYVYCKNHETCEKLYEHIKKETNK